mmetsp:Transcript_18620/g.18861  ORF Transcript_18620/g.18861 Transcript_18620/m.18861 type:complete len:140 (+) Transcript_18620:517-936(+)
MLIELGFELERAPDDEYSIYYNGQNSLYTKLLQNEDPVLRDKSPLYRYYANDDGSSGSSGTGTGTGEIPVSDNFSLNLQGYERNCQKSINDCDPGEYCEYNIFGVCTERYDFCACKKQWKSGMICTHAGDYACLSGDCR